MGAFLRFLSHRGLANWVLISCPYYNPSELCRTYFRWEFAKFRIFRASYITDLSPESFQLIKTLVYKPKTEKTATSVPIIVVAHDKTKVNSGAIGKKFNLKELWLVSEDLLTEFFRLTRIPVYHSFLLFCCHEDEIFAISPLSITESVFSKVVMVFDSSIGFSTSTFTIHANSSSQMLFLSEKDIKTYLKKLETAETKVQEFNFSTIMSVLAPAAHSLKAPVKDGKIEGAVQIAIGVVKEVNFPGWYTNVSWYQSSILSHLLNLWTGAAEGWLLQCQVATSSSPGHIVSGKRFNVWSSPHSCRISNWSYWFRRLVQQWDQRAQCPKLIFPPICFEICPGMREGPYQRIFPSLGHVGDQSISCPTYHKEMATTAMRPMCQGYQLQGCCQGSISMEPGIQCCGWGHIPGYQRDSSSLWKVTEESSNMMKHQFIITLAQIRWYKTGKEVEMGNYGEEYIFQLVMSLLVHILVVNLSHIQHHQVTVEDPNLRLFGFSISYSK